MRNAADRGLSSTRARLSERLALRRSRTDNLPVGVNEHSYPEQDRRDRQVSELSGELRVILPAVTVLVAFLLTVPFASGFERLHGVERAGFFVAFISTGAAIVLRSS